MEEELEITTERIDDFVVLLGLMLYYHLVPTVALVLLPLFVILCVVTAFSVGLWLSARTARTLRHGSELEAFRDWMREVGLLPYTVNGCPIAACTQKRLRAVPKTSS